MSEIESAIEDANRRLQAIKTEVDYIGQEMGMTYNGKSQEIVEAHSEFMKTYDEMRFIQYRMRDKLMQLTGALVFAKAMRGPKA